MSINAQDILDHCKAVCEGRKPQPLPFWVTPTDILYCAPSDGRECICIDWGPDLAEDWRAFDMQLAARILGLDRSAPVVELEWVEDELKYGSVAHHAYYNGLIECCISANQDGKAKFAWISVNRSRVANMPEKYQHVKTDHEARAWCVEQITKIITPTPTMKP